MSTHFLSLSFRIELIVSRIASRRLAIICSEGVMGRVGRLRFAIVKWPDDRKHVMIKSDKNEIYVFNIKIRRTAQR